MRASPYKFPRGLLALHCLPKSRFEYHLIVGYRESKAAGLNIKYDRMMKAINTSLSSQYRRRQFKKLPSVSDNCNLYIREDTYNVGNPPSWLTQTLLTPEPGHVSHQLLARSSNEVSIQLNETDTELQSIFAYFPRISHQRTRFLGSEEPLVDKIDPERDDYVRSYTPMQPPVKECRNIGVSLASAQHRYYSQVANEIIVFETLPYSTPGPTFNMGPD